MKQYKVKEIFGPTLQGEGSQAGTVVMFLRMTGCNRWSGRADDKADSICSFCDTDFLGGEMKTAGQIVVQLNYLSLGVKHVVISGGEPLLQVDAALVKELITAGYKVHLETNGSIKIDDSFANLFHHITVSPKQPFSETKLQWAHDLKILYPWIGDGISPEGFSTFRCAHRFIQPQWQDVVRSNQAQAVNEVLQRPNYRLSLQLHKILGVQ